MTTGWRKLSAGGLATMFVTFGLLSASSQAAPHTPQGGAGTKTVMMRGELDCSDVLGTSGYGGSPSSLTLRSGRTARTVDYPRSLPIPGSSIFGTPQREEYKFQVKVPLSQEHVTFDWSLSCQDQDGNPTGTWHGSFSAVRSATRDICNHGGTVGLVLTICNPPLSDKLGSCAWAILTAEVDSPTLDHLSDAADPPKTALEKAEAALADAGGPLVGLVLACGPLVLPSPPISGSTTTTTAAGQGWPVHRNDGSSIFYVYLGSDFILPDWVSCDPNYCIAGSGGTVYAFTLSPINQIGQVSESADPQQALLSLGIPAADTAQLLAPTG